MMMSPGIHLVGSIPLGSAEEVFSTVGAILGDSVKRIPDGETGERSNWIAWQLPLLEANPHMEVDPETDVPTHSSAEDGLAVDAPAFRFLRVKPGVSAAQLALHTAYAENAVASFQQFSALRSSGTIPANVRFQVSLPTPYAVASLYVSPASWPVFIPAYQHAMLHELERIASEIPRDLLAIQWDVCMEVMAWEGELQSPADNLAEYTFHSIGTLCDAVPTECDVGIHLCYGDPGHKHIVEPKDTTILVSLANGICAGTSRPINWIHMPVPIERHDKEYFVALQDLRLDAGCELYLGLIHFRDQDGGAARRLASARRFVNSFGIATECGFGRRPAETVVPLLELHRRCAAMNDGGQE